MHRVVGLIFFPLGVLADLHQELVRALYACGVYEVGVG